jgi:hypothetical protein
LRKQLADDGGIRRRRADVVVRVRKRRQQELAGEVNVSGVFAGIRRAKDAVDGVEVTLDKGSAVPPITVDEPVDVRTIVGRGGRRQQQRRCKQNDVEPKAVQASVHSQVLLNGGGNGLEQWTNGPPGRF